MHNEFNNIATLAFFAKEVETFLKVVERWNIVVAARGDVDSFVAIASKDWIQDRECCLIKVQCNNPTVLFHIGRLFAEDCRIATLR